MAYEWGLLIKEINKCTQHSTEGLAWCLRMSNTQTRGVNFFFFTIGRETYFFENKWKRKRRCWHIPLPCTCDE